MVIRKRLKIKGNAIVFVTTSTVNWQPILTKDTVAQILIDELKKTLSIYEVSLICYVIMPSHIHYILGFKQIEFLSKFMQNYKSITSRKIKKLGIIDVTGTKFRIWQNRFDDLIISTHKQFKIKMDYIHNNPVKAGLIDKAENWQYSSAMNWICNKDGLLDIDMDYSFLK